MMQTRRWCFGLVFMLLMRLASAHHAWVGVDLTHPIYLEGQAVTVKWGNPHVSLRLLVPATLTLPDNLATWLVPPQRADFDGQSLLRKTTLAPHPQSQWEIELAPLPMMQAWRVPRIAEGARVAVIGYIQGGEKGATLVRVEYLFLDGKAYAMRSAPK